MQITLTVAGYTGIRNSLSVDVAYRPRANLALTAPEPVGEAGVDEVATVVFLRVAKYAPTPPPMRIMIRTGTPILIQLLRGFFFCAYPPGRAGMYPVESL